MFLAIDLGGTQVRVALAAEDGRLGRVMRASTPAFGGPAGLVAWVAAAAGKLAGHQGLAAAGIGVPGPCNPNTGVLVNPPNLAGWPRNVPLADMISQVLRIPVHLENDANLAAIAEHTHGAGRGSMTMVYVTWSTGIGAGLILGGRLHSGPHGTAGEVGHMILDPNGPPCACGQRGCLEVYAGGAAMSMRTGRSATDIFTAARAGEREASAIVEEAARRFGTALVNLTNLLDPEVIVVGGGVTASWGLVSRHVLAALRGSPFITPGRRPALRRAALGPAVTLVGAGEWARIRS